jgi:hypothetical protein
MAGAVEAGSSEWREWRRESVMACEASLGESGQTDGRARSEYLWACGSV